MATSVLNSEMDQLSIQEMVKKAINHQIPSRYIVNQEPVVSVNSSDQEKNFSSEIPVFDMKTLLAGETRTLELEKLRSTFKNFGTFQLVNYGGVDLSLVEKLKQEIQEFYKLPLEERLRFKIRLGDVEGYGQTIINFADQKVDWADRFYMTTNPTNRRRPHLLPDLASSFRETLEAYISELQKLSGAIFELIAETLGIDKRKIEEMFDDGMQSSRMTYYPPCPEPGKVFGLTPHSDAGGITILLQVNGVEGLQIKRDGVWVPVKFLLNAFVVNIGDIIEILSNGLYNSIEHRATVNPEKERISFAMFFNPKFEAQIEPSPSLSINQPPRFRSMNTEQYFKEFFSKKLDGKSFLSYLKIQEEV